MTDTTAELVVRAGIVHTLDPAAPPTTCLAVRDGQVVAVAGPDQERESLAAWIGRDTTVLDDPRLVVLPAFVDTHNHLIMAARDILGVPVGQARDIPALVELIRQRAAETPAGQWIVTASDWHELRLAEERMPTADELDEATTSHPVLVPRGGHNGVLNSVALRLAGFGPDSPDVPGGFIARDTTGRPTGWLQDAALELALRVLPSSSEDELLRGLARACAAYAAHGIATVRDPAVSPREWHTYSRAQAAGQLSIRSHAMIFSTPRSIADAGSTDAYLDALEEQGIMPGTRRGLLHLWGLKFVLDGGVEAAALRAPYVDRPDFFGELLWDRDELGDALATCVRRGWPVGTHAFGDRAIAVLLEAIRDVTDRTGPVPPGMLVMEHGGLATAELIDEATELGVHITVQQALLDGLAKPLLAAWGAERTAQLFPLRELVDAGTSISAGTDHPIGPLDPLRGLYGMTLRSTSAGVLGAEHAISRAEALRLYTTAGADLLGRPAVTALGPGGVADLVAYPTDPLTCPPEELLRLTPTFTVVNGNVTHPNV